MFLSFSAFFFVRGPSSPPPLENLVPPQKKLKKKNILFHSFLCNYFLLYKVGYLQKIRSYLNFMGLSYSFLKEFFRYVVFAQTENQNDCHFIIFDSTTLSLCLLVSNIYIYAYGGNPKSSKISQKIGFLGEI